MTHEELEYLKQLAKKSDNATLCTTVLVLCDLDIKIEKTEKSIEDISNRIGL